MDTGTMLELIKIRVISFCYQVGTALVVLAIGYFASPQFADVVTAHFGAVAGGIVALLIPEVVKHFRNIAVVNAAANNLGGGTEQARRHVTLV